MSYENEANMKNAKDRSWFKAFCDSNRLRYRLSEDAHPVAVSAGKWKNDQFYDGFGKGVIGIYVRRETKTQYTYLKKRLVEKFGCELTQGGDTEGCFTIDAWAALPVAKHLRITKHKRRVSNPSWLHTGD